MRLDKVRKTATGLLLGGLLLGLLGGFAVKDQTLVYVMCALAVACIAGYWGLLMKFWRCPKCGGLLPVKQYFWSVKNCPQCGQELDLSRW